MTEDFYARERHRLLAFAHSVGTAGAVHVAQALNDRAVQLVLRSEMPRGIIRHLADFPEFIADANHGNARAFIAELVAQLSAQEALPTVIDSDDVTPFRPQ